MPQDLTVPGWYNDDHYISEKVDECNTIKFGAVEGEEFTPWTAETVRDFLAQANEADSYAPWMGFDNFVSKGNAENCSPNPLFNVMQYVAAKANQLNAMNDGAGYEGNNAWTAQSVLDYFNAHNITAWDHFTTSGQFEDINPSNAMDLSEFLTKKAAQCNAMEFAGKSDWDEQAVLDYYQEHGINAVMVAVNSSDPNVVIVPEDAQVRVPANLTPWGINESVLNPVELTTANDVVSDDGVPSNFIGDISTSASKSTLNAGDQITGTNEADQLTVDMSGVWAGFRGNGFMKNVPTINLNNTTENRDLAFYANGIEGTDTYNIDGNISLYNLGAAGITVNYSNLDTSAPVNLYFTDEAIKGDDDSLTLGLNNVRDPLQIVDGEMKYGPVSINANDIEHLTVNSTGTVKNKVDLNGVDTAEDLAVTGDADLEVTDVASSIKTIDGTAATGDISIDASQGTNPAVINSAKFGSGDDKLTVWSIETNAQIDGGEGNDNLVMTRGGVYQLAMNDVETLTASRTHNGSGVAENLTLDGSNTDGLENLVLINQQGNTSLTNFNSPLINVTAKGIYNTGDLAITDVPEVTLTVGDGKANTNDKFAGALTASDAQSLSITTETSDSGKSAQFDSTVTADNVRSLSLSAGNNGSITIDSQSSLAQVDQIQIAGNGGNVTVVPGSAVATEANSLYVNGQSLVGGVINLELGNNKEDDGILNYVGSSTGKNNVTVDGTYATVSFYGGSNNDTLTIAAASSVLGGTTPTTPWNPGNLSGDLGSGNDTLIINGTVPAGTDLSGITGVEVYKFTSFTQAQLTTMLAGSNPQIILPEGFNAAVGSNVLGSDSDDPETTITNTNLDVPGTSANETITVKLTDDLAAADAQGGGEGGTDTFVGEVNTSHKFTMNGGTGSAVVDFGSDPATGLKVTAAEQIIYNSGSGAANSVTGKMTAAVPVIINATQGSTNVDLGVAGDQTVTVNDSATNADSLKINGPSSGTATVDGAITNAAAILTLNGTTGGTLEYAPESFTSGTLQVSGAGTIDINTLPDGPMTVTQLAGTTATVNVGEIGGVTAPTNALTYVSQGGASTVNTDTTGNVTYESTAGGDSGTLAAASTTKATLQLDDTAADDLTFGTLTLTAATELDLVSNKAGQKIDLSSATLDLAALNKVVYSGEGDVKLGDLGGTTALANGLTVKLAGSGDFSAGGIKVATTKDIVIGGEDGTSQVSVGSLTLGNLQVETDGGSISVNAKTSDAANKIVITSADADTVTINAAGSNGAIEGASSGTLNITGKNIEFTAGNGGSTVKATVDAVADDAVEGKLTGGTGADEFTITSTNTTGVAEFTINGGDNTGGAKDSLTISANASALQFVTISDADATTWDKITLSFKQGTAVAQTEAVLTKTLDSFGVDVAGAAIDNTDITSGYFKAGTDYYLVTAFATDASTDVAAGNTLVKLTGVDAADIAGIVSAMFTTSA